MRVLSLSCLVILLSSVNAWEFSRRFAVHEEKLLNHEVRIELVQRNLEVLRTINHEISDPKSDIFGNFLASDEIKALIGQPKEVTDEIFDWLHEQDCDYCPMRLEIGPHGDYIFLESCISRLQCIFDNEMALYGNGRNEIARTTERIGAKDFHKFNIPRHLHQYMYRVMQLGEIPYKIRWMGNVRPAGEADAQIINPNKIRENYGVTGYPIPSGVSGAQASQAAGQFYNDYFFPSDLLTFQSDYSLPENNITANHTIGRNNPSTVPTDNLYEPTLDYEYISTVEDLETWAFTNAFSFIGYCQKVARTADAPYIQSLSWGSTESVTDEDDAFRTSDEFMKMTTQGFTFFLATGDSGTDSTDDECDKFDPGFPATSPYVTAVGATYLQRNSLEQCSGTFSGSGFSTFFDRPSYQDSAVSTYFDTEGDLPSSSKYNSSGRGIPDIAAYGYNFKVLVNGQYTILYGTSASTPVTASLVAYANAARLSAGKGPLGNINPRLYQSGKVGTDVTCGQSKDSHCSKGFQAAAGWDPATGLGAPLADVFFPLLTDN